MSTGHLLSYTLSDHVADKKIYIYILCEHRVKLESEQHVLVFFPKKAVN